MQRPTSVTVFGVLNIVFGVMGLAGIVFSAAMLFLNTMPSQDGPNSVFDQHQHPVIEAWSKISIPLGAVATLVLTVSGFGLLKLRGWARILAIGWSVYSIVTTVIGCGLQWIFFIQPMLGAFRGGQGTEETAFVVGSIAGAVIGGGIGLGYALLLWFYMTRQHVMAAFGVREIGADEPIAPSPSARSPAESTNPYYSPQTEFSPRAESETATSDAAESIAQTFVPSKNGPALVSYYLGLFSLFPLLGFPLGVVAVYFGVKGLGRARENPAVRGAIHAWVGIICGSLFGLFNFVLLALVVVGVTAAVTGQ